MKRIIVISAFCFIVSFIQAQSIYSVENLQKLSQEELDVYYANALKLQKSGKTVSIVGGSILGATTISVLGIAAFGTDDWPFVALAVAVFGGIPGLGTTIVGISMKSTGKKRVSRINTIRNTAFKDINFDLLPTTQYNYITQNYQPAVTLRVRF